MWYLSFSAWVTSLNMIFYSICWPTKLLISRYCFRVLPGAHVPRLHDPLISCRTFVSIPIYSEYSSNEHSWPSICGIWSWVLWAYDKETHGTFTFSFWGIFHTDFHSGCTSVPYSFPFSLFPPSTYCCLFSRSLDSDSSKIKSRHYFHCICRTSKDHTFFEIFLIHSFFFFWELYICFF